MENYEESRFKLTNTQLSKLKAAAKNKTGTRENKGWETKEKFQDEKLPHELFLTTIQKTKIRNAFTKNISNYIEHAKAQLFKMIPSSSFLCSTLGSLGSIAKGLGKK